MARVAQLDVPVIARAHLPRPIRSAAGALRAPGRARSRWANRCRAAPVAAPSSRSPVGTDDERAQVERALGRSGGNISQAATLLGLTRQGLKKRMVRLGMRVPAKSASEKPG